MSKNRLSKYDYFMERYIQAKVGVFFNEIIGGCSCGDDPLSENAYCELQVSIDKVTAEAEFSVNSI